MAERSIPARERLRQLRSACLWPPVVPAVVLTEALRGDPRRDFLDGYFLKDTGARQRLPTDAEHPGITTLRSKA